MHTLRGYRVFPPLLLILFVLLGQDALAEQEYYTVQAGSYDQGGAEKHYSMLARTLSPPDRDYLRIEVVQGYHTVRVGRFVSRPEAKKTLDLIHDLYPGAVLLSAYIKEERIRKIVDQPRDEGENGASPSVQETLPAAAAPPVLDGPVLDGDDREYYTIQAGSYDALAAEKNYSALLEMLEKKDRDYLRIEVVKGIHAVRIGRFLNRHEAETLLSAVQEKYPGALILSAYLRSERIARIWSPDPVAQVEKPPAELPQEKEPSPEEETAAAEAELKPVPPVTEGMAPEVKESAVVAETPVQVVKREFRKNIVATLVADEQGQPLHYPSSVFADTSSGELFVVVGGSKKGGVVFGPEYLPEVSLGAGRDVVSSVGGFIDGAGNLYLCQQALGEKPSRLSIFNSAFFLVKEIYFSDFGEGFADFAPKQAAVSPVSGTIYLAGSPGHGVMVLGRNGEFLRWLEPEIGQGRPGKREKIGPDSIVDVTIDSGGDIYLLSEETSSIYIYSPLEEFIQTVGEKGGVYGKLSRPRGVAVDRKRGIIYVVDYLRHSIILYDMAGVVLAELGGRGISPGWFNFPTDLAVDRNQNLVIADFFNQRVQVWEIVEERRISE